MHLFTDGSVDPKSKIGYGASLALTSLDPDCAAAKPKVKTKAFRQTSSTRLELQTFLWALETQARPDAPITHYTDSQNILGLPARRQKLEAANFQSRSGSPVRNADLYKTFYAALDRYDLTFEKVKGHQPAKGKTNIETLFTQVDRAARKALKSSRTQGAPDTP